MVKTRSGTIGGRTGAVASDDGVYQRCPLRARCLVAVIGLLFWGVSVTAAAATSETIENEQLHVKLNTLTGALTVFDKIAQVRWVPPSERMGKRAEHTGRPSCRNVRRLDAPTPGLSFRISLHVGKPKRLDVAVKLLLPRPGRDLLVELAADNQADVRWFDWPAPIVPAAGAAWLVTTAYNGGMLLPMVKGRLPRRHGGWELPFFGVTNVEKGFGYACIYQTPFDVQLLLGEAGTGAGAPMAGGVLWRGSKGKWGYTRKLLYRFTAKGGYVAIAKAYRRYAQDSGLLKTLREKMKRRPDIAKLLGAPDVWGGKGLAFCREAKAAGIDRMLVNGSWGKKDTEAIKKLGYLVSRYDNYEDMMAGKGPPHGLCKVPDDQVLLANGKRMTAWPVYAKDAQGRVKRDPKTRKPIVRERFSKRCSMLYEKTARQWVPADQSRHPRNARFLDVSTACGLRECYDPKHGHGREGDSRARCRLARYISNELGLVLGGEHGVWWGVPYYDYWEGMQSGGFYSWPAGHLFMDLPRSRKEIGKDYLTYGIGHYYRIPLWELIFGDCAVSYWYWGDSTGHLYHIAPEITRKKDLFNMLYGTLPLYWVDRPAGLNWSKPKLRKRLLESYRTTCKLHEHTGLEELTNHEWLTADRTVQKSTFADGTFVVVNFHERNVYKLKDAGKTWPIAPLGFYARGPHVHQYRIHTAAGDVTYVHTDGYWFADGGTKGHDFGAIRTPAGLTVRKTAGQLGPDRLSPQEDGWFRLLPAWLPTEVVCGPQVRRPNLAISHGAIRVTPMLGRALPCGSRLSTRDPQGSA